MTKLTGKDALDLLDQIGRRNEEEQDQRLAAARLRAAERGKEPFDLERFEALYNMSERRKQREGPPEKRLKMREYDYYVMFEGVMTIEEYAKELWEVRDQWDGP